MKFLEILVNFLATQGMSFMHGSKESLTQQIVNNARRVARLLVFVVLSIVLFSIGFSMAYSGIVQGIEETGAWAWSPPVIWGLALALLAICGMVYALGEERWLDATDLKRRSESPPPPPSRLMDPMLEAALAALITEFAQGLKEGRKNAASPQKEDPQV
jgi:hypothetical protein